MDGMEEKLNSILGNPQMMQQIMSMAQSLGASPPPPEAPPPAQPAFAGIDPGMLEKIAGMARQSGIDKNQQNLLHALTPYLCKDRIVKLEKAMRAAKLTGLVVNVFGSGNIPFLSGR